MKKSILCILWGLGGLCMLAAIPLLLATKDARWSYACLAFATITRVCINERDLT